MNNSTTWSGVAVMMRFDTTPVQDGSY